MVKDLEKKIYFRKYLEIVSMDFNETCCGLVSK